MKIKDRDKIILGLNETIAHLRKEIDRYELDPFIDGDQLRGDLIDEDEHISPHSVATLGAYSAVMQIRKKIAEILGVELDKPVKKNKTKGVIAVELDIVSGKTKVVKNPDLPPEVIKVLKNIIKENENGQ